MQERHQQENPPPSGGHYQIGGHRSPGRKNGVSGSSAESSSVPFSTTISVRKNPDSTNVGVSIHRNLSNEDGLTLVRGDFGLKKSVDSNLDPSLVDVLVHQRRELRQKMLSGEVSRARKEKTLLEMEKERKEKEEKFKALQRQRRRQAIEKENKGEEWKRLNVDHENVYKDELIRDFNARMTKRNAN
eukprot:GDKJ01024601.1.p1 GENE.GDKJ01024601.1~~GDKJ01024601.1.p1  ORF type:complete len:187 (-),score=44.54 GDKJ01024601.1:41-601(-)